MHAFVNTVVATQHAIGGNRRHLKLISDYKEDVKGPSLLLAERYLEFLFEVNLDRTLIVAALIVMIIFI